MHACMHACMQEKLYQFPVENFQHIFGHPGTIPKPRKNAVKDLIKESPMNPQLLSLTK